MQEEEAPGGASCPSRENIVNPHPLFLFRALSVGALALALVLLPRALQAGTWTDDFDDGVLTPPWIDIEGTNVEVDGALTTTDMSSDQHVGPVVQTVVPELNGEDHLHLAGSFTSDGGGTGFTLKSNGVDRCGIYVWYTGAIWWTNEADNEGYLAEATLSGLPLEMPTDSTTPVEFAAELDGSAITLWLQGVEVFQGIHPLCDFEGDGTVGIELHVGRTASWDSFSASWYEEDADGDGYCPGDFCADPLALPGDCDDGDSANWPDNDEICDGQDNNCDGLADDGDPAVISLPTWWTDSDSDGYGDPATASQSCLQPVGTTSNGNDCDDGNPAINPAASEACNGIDDNCDTFIAASEADDDGDGERVCDGDCNDDDANVNTSASEACNGVDDNCDGTTPSDEDDDDDDGARICDGDCDDWDDALHPGATELCNGQDDDCSGVLDPTEADDDADGQLICEGDCDDNVSSTYLGAPELCNGQDDNCDLIIPSDEVDDDGDAQRVCAGD